MGQGRFFFGNIAAEQFNMLLVPLYVYEYARGCIGDFTFKLIPVGKLVNKGPKADPLNDPVYLDSSGNAFFRQSLSIPSFLIAEY